MRATLAGLNFALAQSKDFVAKKIIEAPLIPGHTVTVSMQAVSTLDFLPKRLLKRGVYQLSIIQLSLTICILRAPP